MKAIRSTGMKPEMRVRRLVHSLGYRYRLHKRGLPGKPDMVFVGLRKIIFVHGCFWHSHDDPSCPLVHKPRSNLDYWSPKLARTKQRDRENTKELESDGWSVLEIWECETRDIEFLKGRIVRFLEPK